MPNRRLLIIDDSVTIRAMIEQVFVDCGEVDIVGVAKSGEEAVVLIKKLRPDVVTLDLMLPGIDGFEVLDSIMTSFPIPVIVISSAGVEGSYIHSRAIDAGASAVFDKAKILSEAPKLRSAVMHVKRGHRRSRCEQVEKGLGRTKAGW